MILTDLVNKYRSSAAWVSSLGLERMAELRPPYKLRAELRGHDEDVRSLLVCEMGLLTGSRDKTIKLWKEVADGYQIENTYVGHESYVTALQYIPAGLLANLPAGAIVSGSRDTTLKLWNPSTCEVMQTLSGHKYQVTDLAIMPDGSIVSASLDSTLRVWRDNKCVHVLEGHEGAVQSVVCLPSGEIVSGSNDTTIRVWRDGKCVHVITGHTDTVRGLAVLPGLGVVSASHDQTLRVWTFTGESIATLCGHSAIIYRAAASSTGLIASAAEDNTARLWQADGTALQSIEHPACVWDVAFLPDGDLVTACADYVARVWTTSPDHAAQAEDIEVYEASLAERKASAAAASGSGTESGLPEGLKLEPETALLQPGKKAGDMKVIREGGTGMVYTWDADRGQWEKVGEVVGGPAQSDTMNVPSKWHNGQQHDFVVDVDFEEGVPPKKLAFNRSDNPYNVAERFLADEGLPMTYRQQVVDYILNLMGRDSALPSAATADVDPFTGSGAYVAGASAVPAPGRPSNSSDPFTASGAYVPAASSMHQPAADGSQTSQGADKTSQHIPATSFIIFSNLPKLEAIRSKLCEFNSMLSALPEKASLTLGETDVAPGGTLDSVLARAVESTTSGNAAALSKEEGHTLRKLLCWPANQLFPALDIARMLALSQTTADALADSAGAFESSGCSGGIGGALATAGAEPQLPSNLQTGLRLACNLFKHASTQHWIQGACMAVIDAYSAAGASSNKAVRSSWASFLVNMSLMLCPPSHAASLEASKTSEGQAMILSAAAELLSTCPEDDSETVARALLAAGTVMNSSREQKGMGRDLGLVEYAQKYKGSPNPKVVSVAEEVLRL